MNIEATLNQHCGLRKYQSLGRKCIFLKLLRLKKRLFSLSSVFLKNHTGANWAGQGAARAGGQGGGQGGGGANFLTAFKD